MKSLLITYIPLNLQRAAGIDVIAILSQRTVRTCLQFTFIVRLPVLVAAACTCNHVPKRKAKRNLESKSSQKEQKELDLGAEEYQHCLAGRLAGWMAGCSMALLAGCPAGWLCVTLAG